MRMRTALAVERQRSLRLPTSALLGLVLALLATLAFAACAHAAEPGEQQSAATTGSEAQAPVSSASESESEPVTNGDEAPAPTSTQGETGTPSPEGTTTAPPATTEETMTTQSAPEGEATQAPSGEEAAQTLPQGEEAAQTLPPVQEAVQTPLQSEEPTQTTPTETTQTKPEEPATPILVSVEVSPPTRIVEEAGVKPPTEEGKTASMLEEATVGGRGGSSGQGSATQTATSQQAATAVAGAEDGAQGIVGATIGMLATQNEDGGPRVPPSSGAGTSKANAVRTSSGVGDDPVCALASLERRMPGICSGWLSTQRVLSSASLAAAITAGSSRTQTGTSDGGSRGPAVESAPPSSPTPGPSPSGAGGAAAAGGSGMALGFLSLAGLLLLAAPLAMRRLRLSFCLWRASCVALIPERPG